MFVFVCVFLRFFLVFTVFCLLDIVVVVTSVVEANVDRIITITVIVVASNVTVVVVVVLIVVLLNVRMHMHLMLLLLLLLLLFFVALLVLMRLLLLLLLVLVLVLLVVVLVEVAHHGGDDRLAHTTLRCCRFGRVVGSRQHDRDVDRHVGKRKRFNAFHCAEEVRMTTEYGSTTNSQPLRSRAQRNGKLTFSSSSVSVDLVRARVFVFTFT